MNAQKKIFLSATLLMTFAVFGALFVGVTHDGTWERIEQNEREMLLKTLNTILAKDEYDNDLLNSAITLNPDYLLGTDEPSIAYIASKDNTPVAVILKTIAPNGYNGPIDLLVGIYFDGRVAGTRVIKHRETPGLGDAIDNNKSDWILGFTGRSLSDPSAAKWKVKRDGGVYDQFTGATITPRAVVKAIHSALIYFDKNKKRLSDTSSNKMPTSGT